MKSCPQCGALCEDDAKFCTTCGQSFADEVSQAPRVATKAEFIALPENQPLKKQLSTSGILCYIFAAVNLIVTLVTGNTLGILDVVILLVLGLFIHLKHSRTCAIILLIYAVFSVVMNLIATGKLGGYLIVIAGIYAVVSAFKLDKAWKEYQGK
ncbi:MAG: hypothetical protein J6P48_03205 [Oscillospiraceae bacterium]|nr:hypothetical protein [Oscillospiraceae bacterium]